MGSALRGDSMEPSGSITCSRNCALPLPPGLMKCVYPKQGNSLIGWVSWGVWGLDCQSWALGDQFLSIVVPNPGCPEISRPTVLPPTPHEFQVLVPHPIIMSVFPDIFSLFMIFIRLTTGDRSPRATDSLWLLSGLTPGTMIAHPSEIMEWGVFQTWKGIFPKHFLDVDQLSIKALIALWVPKPCLLGPWLHYLSSRSWLPTLALHSARASWLA